MIKTSALALAALAPTKQKREANLLPPLANIHSISLEIARAVEKQAIKEGLAAVDEAEFEQALKASVWEPAYEPYERV
jgi:malate dehydrogenase (oxaloacetate-decarboxylating)